MIMIPTINEFSEKNINIYNYYEYVEFLKPNLIKLRTIT